LAEKDNALMENIEVKLREQLRQLIQDRVSIEEIQQPIDKINNNLDNAEKLFAAAYDVTIIQPGIGYSFCTKCFYIYIIFSFIKY
jgi:hypothetical protein